MKTLVIGDIHGCWLEFQDLLAKAGLSPDDRVIALGDILDRGPDSAAVLRFFRAQPQANSLLGNHERKHVLAARGIVPLSPSQQMARAQFTENEYTDALVFLNQLPLHVDLPEALLIHGSLDPDEELAAQTAEVLTGSMAGENSLRRKYAQPWYELYHQEKPVLAGHRDFLQTGQPLVVRDRVFLIDTGCCYGRALTGVLLPEFKILSVKSRKNYWGLARQSHRGKKSSLQG